MLGVSVDSVKSHEKFVGKYGLDFPLLADTEKEVANSYGAWGEKKRYGRTYMGITVKLALHFGSKAELGRMASRKLEVRSPEEAFCLGYRGLGV